MKLQAFSINQWLYPDTPVTEQTESVDLHAARNADVCFQLLSDGEVPAGTVCGWKSDLPENFRLTVLQLDPVLVPYNSGAATHVSWEYEPVKDFVTRKAPFSVYDLSRPVEGTLQGGRVALLGYWLYGMESEACGKTRAERAPQHRVCASGAISTVQNR